MVTYRNGGLAKPTPLDRYLLMKPSYRRSYSSDIVRWSWYNRSFYNSDIIRWAGVIARPAVATSYDGVGFARPPSRIVITAG